MQFSAIVNRLIVKTELNSAFTNDLKRKYFFLFENVHSCRLSLFKKRAKRYYLGGFMPTVTREVITEYITMRGPTVTWVSIWNSKRNPNNVVIRLNVTDNHLTDMLEKRSF